MYLLVAFLGLGFFFWGFAAHSEKKNRKFREDTWTQINSIFKP